MTKTYTIDLAPLAKTSAHAMMLRSRGRPTGEFTAVASAGFDALNLVIDIEGVIDIDSYVVFYVCKCPLVMTEPLLLMSKRVGDTNYYIYIDAE